MTAPLVPRDVDLRDFPFMPVDIWRLFGSEFHARCDDAAWRAGMTLWLKSYHQVPASSMPDDDVALARAAELGRDLKTWRRIKADALRGWIKCDDGLLYHPVVAEKALEGWIEKHTQIKSSETGNAKRYGRTYDARPIEAVIEDAAERLKALNPNSRVLRKRSVKAPVGSVCEPSEPPDGRVLPPEKPPKEREGKEREEKTSLRSDGASDAICDRFFEAYPKRAEEDGVRRELGRLIAEGVPIEDILAGAMRYRAECAKRGPEHIASPVRWLRDGRWKDGKPKLERALPVVEQRSAQGQAWDAHAVRTTGKPLLWTNGRRTVETEWPPGYVPDGQRLELAGTAA